MPDRPGVPRYQLESFSKAGNSLGVVEGEVVGRRGGTVHLPGEGGHMVVHFAPGQGERRGEATWGVVDGQERVVAMHVNTAQVRMCLRSEPHPSRAWTPGSPGG